MGTFFTVQLEGVAEFLERWDVGIQAPITFLV